MAILEIYGSSDDLIEMSGLPTADEFYPSNSNGYYKGTWEVIAKGSMGFDFGFRIHAIYDNNGCWSFSIGQMNDNWGLPALNVEYLNHDNGYSTLMKIQVPDNAVVKQLSYD